VDDRMGAADALELRVVPGGTLPALVLAVADLGRRLPECLRRRRSVENELDHLPVTLVEVVPVVEDVEEPVLERKLVRVLGVGHDVGVRNGIPVGAEMLLPVEVHAGGVERVAREVEVVAVEPAAELRRLRRDPDEIVPPGPTQRDGRLAEEMVHVDRDVVKPAAALAPLNEPDDRCVSVRQLVLLLDGCLGSADGRCDGRRDQRRRGGQGEAHQREPDGHLLILRSFGQRAEGDELAHFGWRASHRPVA
jgi:hypothetical protein